MTELPNIPPSILQGKERKLDQANVGVEMHRNGLNASSRLSGIFSAASCYTLKEKEREKN